VVAKRRAERTVGRPRGAAQPDEAPNLATVGGRLKARRLALGLSQYQLAERAGVGRSLVSLLEGDLRGDPSYRNVVAIANALEITPKELMGF